MFQTHVLNNINSKSGCAKFRYFSKESEFYFDLWVRSKKVRFWFQPLLPRDPLKGKWLKISAPFRGRGKYWFSFFTFQYLFRPDSFILMLLFLLHPATNRILNNVIRVVILIFVSSLYFLIFPTLLRFFGSTCFF